MPEKSLEGQSQNIEVGYCQFLENWVEYQRLGGGEELGGPLLLTLCKHVLAQDDQLYMKNDIFVFLMCTASQYRPRLKISV